MPVAINRTDFRLDTLATVAELQVAQGPWDIRTTSGPAGPGVPVVAATCVSLDPRKLAIFWPMDAVPEEYQEDMFRSNFWPTEGDVQIGAGITLTAQGGNQTQHEVSASYEVTSAALFALIRQTRSPLGQKYLIRGSAVMSFPPADPRVQLHVDGQHPQVWAWGACNVRPDLPDPRTGQLYDLTITLPDDPSFEFSNQRRLWCQIVDDTTVPLAARNDLEPDVIPFEQSLEIVSRSPVHFGESITLQGHRFSVESVQALGRRNWYRASLVRRFTGVSV